MKCLLSKDWRLFVQALFNQKLEFKTVDYGYSNETNYGIFAKETIYEGNVVGIYSGATFLIQHPAANDLLTATPKTLSEISSDAISGILATKDYIAYSTFLLKQYAKLDGSSQRTPMKYTYHWNGYDDAILRVIPCNGIYTPMHFVNSCNDDTQENVKLEFFDLGEDKKSGIRRFISCFVSKKVINQGEEILDNYMTVTEYRDRFFETIEDEIEAIKSNLKERQDLVTNFNLKIPKKNKLMSIVSLIFFVWKKLNQKRKL